MAWATPTLVEMAREAENHQVKEAIKGLRWLLLHRRDNPGERRRQSPGT